MKKNGFSIVEMAVVLVVIGIILSMVIKGKSMVKAAWIKSDVAGVNRLEMAMTNFYSLNHRLPKIIQTSGVSSGHFDRDEMVEAGVLSPRDYRTYLFGGGWGYGPIIPASGGGYDGPTCQPSSISSLSQSSIAVKPHDGTTRTAPDLICHIEVVLDDENLIGGMGQGQPSFASYYDNETWLDCDKVIDKLAGGSTPFYSFKVFDPGGADMLESCKP